MNSLGLFSDSDYVILQNAEVTQVGIDVGEKEDRGDHATDNGEFAQASDAHVLGKTGDHGLMLLAFIGLQKLVQQQPCLVLPGAKQGATSCTSDGPRLSRAERIRGRLLPLGRRRDESLDAQARGPRVGLQDLHWLARTEAHTRLHGS